jgi:hypothetical protein
LIQVQCSAMIGEDGERELRRAAPAAQVKPEGRRPPNSNPVGLWLRSSRQGSKDLGSPLSTNHPARRDRDCVPYLEKF